LKNVEFLCNIQVDEVATKDPMPLLM